VAGLAKESASVRLDLYGVRDFQRGRPAWVEALWLVAQSVLVASALPGSRWRTLVLRCFGARIGRGVVLRPRLRVKFPWRLEIGNGSWIGEGVWIDNLAPVRIAGQCCISQGVYFCTGNHDWSSTGFDLVTSGIEVQDQAWLAARSTVGPGVRVGQGAVLGLGSTATRDLAAWQIHSGCPALPVKTRRLVR
jgi:putative colanic acid biosynthesis acetyltransferase WcaF